MEGMAASLGNDAPVRRVRLRQIALPTEHGSWGFLFEPVVAGMAVAFSPAAPWIALLAIGAFLARRPLEILIAQRQRSDRELVMGASRVLIAFSAVAIAGLAGTAIIGGALVLMPFWLAVPLAIFQLYVETTGRGRQLRAELAGAAAMPATAAAMALAAGWQWPAATALWAVLAARFIPSILYVRSRLALEKGKPSSKAIPAAAHIAALGLVIALAAMQLVPWLPVAAFVLLLGRSVSGLSTYRIRMKAMTIGVREVIYGAVMVAALIIGYVAEL